MILCHFNQTLRDFSTTLKTLNYPNDFERWTQGYYSELCIGLSENLPEIAWTDSPQERWIFVTEFYPIPLRDEKIVAWAGPYTHIGFYDSMDSPLFKLFGSEQMITLLEGLGWNDTEPMSNSMITKALQNAQKRVLKKMLVDNPAGSSEEWFEINYPKVNSAQ